jgi:hypothetical protein
MFKFKKTKPYVAPIPIRFIVEDTLEYPWRFWVVDTLKGIRVPKEYNGNHLSLELAEVVAERLNSHEGDGVTFPWEPGYTSVYN